MMSSNFFFKLLLLFFIPLFISVEFKQQLQKSMGDNDIINANLGIIIMCSLLATATSMILYFVIIRMLLGRNKVYLLDFSCYNHDPSTSISRDKVSNRMSTWLNPESLAFTNRVLDRNGVGDNTFIHGWDNFPPECTFSSGREEAETVISGAVDNLFAKTSKWVDPARDIGIVIVNNSNFNPVPSLSAMVVNRYKLRQDVLTFNLGGMGCSAGIIALDLAKRLLQGRRNCHALIVSLECPNAGRYLGNDRSKLVTMCLFRMGGAAVLLSNRSSDHRISKYELKHTLRTHLGADDAAYNCVFQEPDKDGKVGFTLSKTLIPVAGEALKANITALGPLVLPISQQFIFVATLIARNVFKIKGAKAFVPDFKLAFEHFCIHAGGKGVLDQVEKNLKLTKWDMEPSRMTLYRYSNTSSSSLWYELAYAEAKGRVKKGDRVWQIGFGSGFKCASGVWRALRTINPDHQDNPWTNIIHNYPVVNDLASP